MLPLGAGYQGFFSSQEERLGPWHRGMSKSENLQGIRGTLGSGWRCGQRPDGSGSSEPSEKLELGPEGDGGFEQGRLCDQIHVLQPPFWQMCAGGAQAKQREDNEECCCFARVHGLLLSHRTDSLFGLVFLMIRIRGAS